MKKNNFIKDFVRGYDGNFGIYLCALFITIYPVFYFFVSFVYLESFLIWNIYLLVFLPLIAIVWYFVANLIKPSIGFKTRLKNNLNVFKTHKELLFFTLFMLWALLSTILSETFLKTFWGIDIYGSHEGFLMFLFYGLCFYLGFKIKNDKYKEALLIVFFFVTMFVSIITFFDMENVMFKPFLLNNTTRSSMFLNSNHFGYFLVVSLMLSCGLYLTQNKKWLKYTSLVAFALHSIQLSLNNTLGSNLAVLCALIVIFVVMSVKDKKVNYRTLILIAIYSLVSIVFSDKIFSQIISLFKNDIKAIVENPVSEQAKLAGTTRWKLWLNALESIKNNPLFGNGDVTQKPHNEFLQYAQVWGLPALIFYVTALVILFVRAFKNLRYLSNISLVCAFVVGGYIISSFFGNTMPHIMPFFCIFLGLFVSSIPINTKGKRVSENPLKSETAEADINHTDADNNLKVYKTDKHKKVVKTYAEK